MTTLRDLALELIRATGTDPADVRAISTDPFALTLHLIVRDAEGRDAVDYKTNEIVTRPVHFDLGHTAGSALPVMGGSPSPWPLSPNFGVDPHAVHAALLRLKRNNGGTGLGLA